MYHDDTQRPTLRTIFFEDSVARMLDRLEPLFPLLNVVRMELEAGLRSNPETIQAHRAWYPEGYLWQVNSTGISMFGSPVLTYAFDFDQDEVVIYHAFIVVGLLGQFRKAS